MKRLRELACYWRHRNAADIALLKSVRQRNLRALHIDEEGEATLGQFGKKWEVRHSYASPELYNMCNITGCRSIGISGTLYRKPRRHGTFTRCGVMLVDHHLLIFQDALRKLSGKEVRGIHHERLDRLDLQECYVYSGLLTEGDLLYQNRTFDSNSPGHHALPRIYPDDGWTSTDEDVMTCFVVWHGVRRGWFWRGNGGGGGGGDDDGGLTSRFKRVSQLGVPGRSIVFRTRSRAERDHWVLAIQTAIERAMEEGQGEEFRITEGPKSKKDT